MKKYKIIYTIYNVNEAEDIFLDGLMSRLPFNYYKSERILMEDGCTMTCEGSIDPKVWNEQYNISDKQYNELKNIEVDWEEILGK